VVRLRLSEQVRFVGKTNYDEMPGIYRAHDILLAPSARREGLPLSMTEAMLSGCAVVTTGSGGAAEIARSADLPLFKKGDALALARILERLIDNPRELDRIASHGQDVAVREYSSARMIERFCHLVESLNEKRKSRNLSAAAARGRKFGPIAQERL
jgi:glycosyltransferase involved in cell wall biosynthesis